MLGVARGGVAVRDQLAGPAATGGAPAGDVVVGRGAGLGSAGGAAGVFWWLLPRGAEGGLAGLLLCLPLLWPARERPAEGELELLVHDVGQGTAVLLRTARHALWYDVGPPNGGEGSERILVPSLRALGQAPPERVLLSHDDLDHAGNLPSLRLQLPGLPLLAPPGSTIAGAGRCQRGLRWHWDGVDFQVLHPDAGSQRAENEDSCVLRVAGAHGVVLLPGTSAVRPNRRCCGRLRRR